MRSDSEARVLSLPVRHQVLCQLQIWTGADAESAVCDLEWRMVSVTSSDQIYETLKLDMDLERRRWSFSRARKIFRWQLVSYLPRCGLPRF